MKKKKETRPLPDGWKWTRLKGVADVVQGFAFPLEHQGTANSEYPFIKVSDMSEWQVDKVITTAQNTVSHTTLKSLRAKAYPKDTVIFPKVGGALLTNKRAILGSDACFDNNIMGAIPKEINGEYLYYWLSAIDFGSIANIQAMPSIRKSQVEDLVLPVPDATGQFAVVNRLKSQLAEAQRLRHAAERQLEAAKALQSAHFRFVFGELEKQDWPRVSLGKLAHIVSGITLGRKLSDDIQVRPAAYLRVANVKDGFLDLSDVYQINATDSEIDKLRLQKGDLLLTEGGDRDKLGRGTIWENQISECIHQNHIFRVRFDHEQVLPQFASYQIGSPYAKAYFYTHGKQTTGIATINQEVLSNFPFILPPMDEQVKIAERLNPQIIRTAEIYRSIERQFEVITALPNAILQETFGGFEPPA